jgi:hypothetical protein
VQVLQGQRDFGHIKAGLQYVTRKHKFNNA